MESGRTLSEIPGSCKNVQIGSGMNRPSSILVEYFGKDRPVREIWIPHIKDYQIERKREGAAPEYREQGKKHPFQDVSGPD